MKLNLGPFTPTQVEIGVKPLIGVEALVYFSLENAIRLGKVRATAQAVGGYTSYGGPQIPATGTIGRDIVCRVTGRGAKGTGWVMTVQLNVVLNDDGDEVVDTATATFTLPAWSVDQTNFMPFGVVRDFIPDTPANVAMKVKRVTGLAAVTNQTAGNQFEIFSIPEESSFVEIVGATSKGMAMDGPASIAIPDRYDPSKWTKLARGEMKTVAVGFRHMGGMEQLSRYQGSTGTLRYDILKEDDVLWQRQLFSGYQVNVNPADMGEGNDPNEATATGNFSDALFGYGISAV